MPSLLDQSALQLRGLLGPPGIGDAPAISGDTADAVSHSWAALQQWLAQQRALSAQLGLWDDTTGLPTRQGWMTAGSQFANALLMGSTAPEFRGRFALDPYDLKPADNLTPDQQAAVDHYSAGSLYLNGDSPEAEGLRRHLDAAVDASRLSDNARLYRGASIPEEQLAALQPGSVVPLSPGYVSTSTAKEIAQRFHEDVLPGEAAVLMELRVPRGHPALHIPTDPTAEAELGGPQHEVLLPRGMQFRIHSTTERRDGLYHVLAEPVSP